MGLFGKVKSIIPSALDILFPPTCLICERDIKISDIYSPHILPPLRPMWSKVSEDRIICPCCFGEIHFIRGPVCIRCGSPLPQELSPESICGECLISPPPYISGVALGLYEGSLKRAVELLKYRNKRSIARALARLLFILSENWIRSNGIDVVVPIPLHKKRLKERGYNQSILIARELGRFAGIPVEIASLVRTRNTMPQVSLRTKEREDNVKGAFEVKNPERLRGKRVLIVDDVITTGSTVKEATKSLLDSGIDKVFVMAIGKVVRF